MTSHHESEGEGQGDQKKEEMFLSLPTMSLDKNRRGEKEKIGT